MANIEHNLNLSEDAGGFYCEHSFFCVQQTARGLSSMAQSDAGLALVGFLHIPDDRERSASAPRHETTLKHVTRAVRAWASMAGTSSTNHPFLLTGFGAFGDVNDNPSGAFVEDPDVLSALRVETPGPLTTLRLTVDDTGLARLQDTMRQQRPWAVLSLGVMRRQSAGHRVELCATDRNLRWDGAWAHVDGLSARTRLRPNNALATVLGGGL